MTTLLLKINSALGKISEASMNTEAEEKIHGIIDELDIEILEALAQLENEKTIKGAIRIVQDVKNKRIG